MHKYAAFKQILDFPSILNESYLGGEIQNALVREEIKKRMARAPIH